MWLESLEGDQQLGVYTEVSLLKQPLVIICFQRMGQGIGGLEGWGIRGQLGVSETGLGIRGWMGIRGQMDIRGWAEAYYSLDRSEN